MTTHQQTIDLAAQHILPDCTRDGLHCCRLEDPQYLAVIWPWMKQGLEHLKAKNEPRARWLPEHVREQILQGILQLRGGMPAGRMNECFLAHDGTAQQLHGFLVAYPLVDPFVNLPLTWFVWMAYLEPYMLQKLLPEFETQGRARGFRGWKWVTSREGWKRYATAFGAEVVEYAMVKEL